MPLQSVGTACHLVINPGGYEGMGVGESATQATIAGIYGCSEYQGAIRGLLKNQHIEKRRQDKDHMWRWR